MAAGRPRAMFIGECSFVWCALLARIVVTEMPWRMLTHIAAVTGTFAISYWEVLKTLSARRQILEVLRSPLFKHKHWRGIWHVNGWRGARVLEFDKHTVGISNVW